MTTTLIQMVLSSKNKLYYILVLGIPIIIISMFIYIYPYNFTILLLLDYIAVMSSIVLTIELFIQEKNISTYLYLTTMKSENFVMLYRTFSIFIISGCLTLIVSLAINILYYQEIFILQQALYVPLILIADFFYIYLLQYLAINITNILVRNIVVIIVGAISLLSLMTRSLTNFIIFITITGLFLAVTFMNRRLTEELKQEQRVNSQ